MKSQTHTQNLETISRTPDHALLLSELQQAINDSSGYTQQQVADYNTRFCLWSGQSRDGRKWKRNLGVEPFPWEGASDARIRLADEIINEQVAVLMTAWRKGSFQVTAIDAANQMSGVKVSYLMQWMFRTHLRTQLEREVELFLQWRQTHGLAVLGIFWEQQRRTEEVELDIASIVATIEGGELPPEQMAQAIATLEQMLDPLREPELVANLRSQFPTLTQAKARKVAADLRETGKAKVPSVYILSSLPRWEALMPFVDVFWPMNTKDLQRARWVAKREWLTETELRDRAATEGWDEEWVEEAVKLKGRSHLGHGSAWGATNAGRLGRGTVGVASEDYKEQIEVWHMSYRGTDPVTQAPALMESIFHPGLPDLMAAHRLCSYHHQKYPYITGVRERIDFSMTESRGIPDIVAPEQDAVKVQVDSRTDATSITTCPPLTVPLWRAKAKLEFGPGKQIGERRPGEVKFLQPPANDGRSKEIEESALYRAERYFGRHSERVAPVLSQIATQHLADSFLSEMAEAGLMTLQLAQQYLEPTTVQRVIGETTLPFSVSREDIQGAYNLVLTFDTRDLNLDYVKQKLEVINTMVIPADRAGAIDYANFVALAVGCIDPFWAEQIVRRPQAATEGEIEDERKQFALMFSGQEPQPPHEGQNHQLRLQILQQTLEQNPILQQIVGQRQDIAAMLEARVKQMQFQIQQRENAMIGRIGGKGGLEQLQNAA